MKNIIIWVEKQIKAKKERYGKRWGKWINQLHVSLNV